MTASILPFVLAAMNAAAPGVDHSELGTAIAQMVDDHRPLLAEDADKTRSAALMVAVAFRESSLNNDAVGDHGESSCAFQIYLPRRAKTIEGWTGEDLRADVNKCVGVAFRMLVQSVRIDPKAPVSFYARGPRWRSDEAQKISRDRVWLAGRLRTAAIASLAKEEGT